MSKPKLKPGDLAEVLPISEILKTLDGYGTLDMLPFMSEMLQYCGKIFRVKSRVEKTCLVGFESEKFAEGGMKEFKYNDVLFLEGLRCSGTDHGNCQTGCMIFWKEAWLKPYDGKSQVKQDEKINEDELNKILLPSIQNNIYFCQATNLSSATINISVKRRFIKLIKETWMGGITLKTALKSVIVPFRKRIKRFRTHTLVEGSLKKTPSLALNLQPGEIVEVKSFEEILKTLDTTGRNKGLEFTLGMKDYCSKRFKVRSRLERMINEVTGEMVYIKDTVILENVICKYEHMGLGCPRARFNYWREIWLKRVEN